MKVAFIFIVKDGEAYLQQNINLLKRHGGDIYAVENNSVDDTKNILAGAGIKKVITLDLDNMNSTDLCTSPDEDFNCTKRVRRLAYIRQKGLEAVMESGIPYDYVCMLDMDFVEYDASGLDEMFAFMEKNPEVDGIFGMSHVKVGPLRVPYDLGALKPITKVPGVVFKLNKYTEVDSAFSGFGIYRCSSIRHGYDYMHIKDIEHVDFNKQFNKLVVDTHFNPLYESSSKMYLVDKIILIVLLAYVLIRVIQRFINSKP
jgi:hypothetical protein